MQKKNCCLLNDKRINKIAFSESRHIYLHMKVSISIHRWNLPSKPLLEAPATRKDAQDEARSDVVEEHSTWTVTNRPSSLEWRPADPRH